MSVSGGTNWVSEALKRQKRLAQRRTPPAVQRASTWLAGRPIEHWPAPLLEEVAKLFVLTDAQAREAIKGAHAIRAGMH